MAFGKSQSFTNVSGAQAPVVLPSGNDVSIATTVTGTVTYSIEVQLVDGSSMWLAPKEFANLTAGLLPQTLDGPANAVRLNIISGTGTVNMDVAADSRGS